MKSALLLPLVLLAGCATSPRIYAPVRDASYQAIGSRSFWTLSIGDDRIVFGPVSGERERSWPRVLPRREGDARIWESGGEPYGIRIEARPGPCGSDDDRLYEDHVVVRLGEGPELPGCGGRLLRRGPR